MEEVTIKIPGELESEFKAIPRMDLSILVNKILMDKLSRVIRFKQIISKSQLTQEQAEELANEVSSSLAKRYDKLFSER